MGGRYRLRGRGGSPGSTHLMRGPIPSAGAEDSLVLGELEPVPKGPRVLYSAAGTGAAPEGPPKPGEALSPLGWMTWEK